MSDNEIGPTFHLPADLVSITPSAEPTFSYRQENGQDILSALIPTESLGSFELKLPPFDSLFIGKHLVAMAEEIDDLRQQWIDTHHA